ncbi:MAG TPA: sugar phosphate isomerase/epimerase [Longimicrobiales bacterium]|nr:sugar phosphate isomerase/epimerase [Longimicrobiales bacterium]
MSDHGKGAAKPADGVSRRGFIGTAAAATAGLVLAPGSAAAASRSWASSSPGYVFNSPPDSNFGGVQIGTITYSFRSMPGANDAEQLLGYLVAAGIGSVELMGEPIMSFLNPPTTDAPSQNQINQMADPAQREAAQRARDAFNAEMAAWYASPPMERVAALRRMYNDAGVQIHLTKLNAGSEAAADFAFRVAVALGARGNSAELSEQAARMQGPIAQRHGVFTNLHNHAQPGEPNFPGYDAIVSWHPGVAINLDVGHYYGSTGQSPAPVIMRHHDRILSFHLKDKTSPADGDFNMPWGLGGTPLAEILRLVRREGYNINADIELEYQIPEGSNAVIEVRKCLEICRDALTHPGQIAAEERRQQQNRTTGAEN